MNDLRPAAEFGTLQTPFFNPTNSSYEPYEKLLYNPSLYLDKNKKYYFYCKKGIKSKKVVSILEIYGYDVTRVIN